MPWKFNPFSGTLDQTGAGGGGGAQYIDGEVATYNDLPLDGTAAADSAWLVREASGTWLIGRKPAGIYIRTATGGSSRDADYTYAGIFPDVFNDAHFTLFDSGDSTRTAQFQLSGITAGQNRVLTVPDSSGTISLNGHTHAASDITSGTIDTARLASGTANNTTYLRGDQTWATVSAGIAGSTSTDNAIVRADSTANTVQESAFIIPDNSTASPNNTVNHASIQATGSSTNVSVSIVPKGTGAFMLRVPDAASTGGNVRGANSVDLQTNRSAATQVASGDSAVLSGGVNNTASGAQAVVGGGFGNTASGQQSIVFGGRNNTASNDRSVAAGDGCTASAAQAVSLGWANSSSATSACALGETTIASAAGAMAICIDSVANRRALLAQAAGRFAAQGDAQRIHSVLRNKTTNATATELFLDGSSARLTIPSGKVMAGIINCVGVKSDGSAVAHYVREFCGKNVAGTSSLVGTVTTVGADQEDNASTDISVTVSDANDAVTISVTGIASETWRWVASVDAVEVAYGT